MVGGVGFNIQEDINWVNKDFYDVCHSTNADVSSGESTPAIVQIISEFLQWEEDQPSPSNSRRLQREKIVMSRIK